MLGESSSVVQQTPFACLGESTSVVQQIPLACLGESTSVVQQTPVACLGESTSVVQQTALDSNYTPEGRNFTLRSYHLLGACTTPLGSSHLPEGATTCVGRGVTETTSETATMLSSDCPKIRLEEKPSGLKLVRDDRIFHLHDCILSGSHLVVFIEIPKSKPTTSAQLSWRRYNETTATPLDGVCADVVTCFIVWVLPNVTTTSQPSCSERLLVFVTWMYQQMVVVQNDWIFISNSRKLNLALAPASIGTN